MILRDKRVLVVGAGKTGMAVARFCDERGAQVTVTDRRGASELLSAADALRPGIRWELGGHDARSFMDADLIVLSPGVPEIAELRAARAAGVAVTGEVELAARYIKAPIVGVTGTNGKSTVTSLAGEMARRTGRPTFVGGNLGTPLITAVGTPAAGPDGIVVVELSSFQLETCEMLHCKAATILNVTPDHLDRYADVAAYTRAKLRIAARMTPADALVVNADDAPLAEIIAAELPSLLPLRYSTRPGTPNLSARIGDDALELELDGAVERYPLAELHLVGRHNLGNALAALLLMRGSGLCTQAEERAGLGAFRALPHRMQLVGHKRGVQFYDDSKATNVDSVVAGLDGFPAPFVLIAGGRDKGGSYAPIFAALQKATCRGVVLIGEAAELIAAALPGIPQLRADSMAAAVQRAATLVRAGDAVILSPACSSYDMFDNYEHRGRAFVAAVEDLPE